jgi:hypothetical protein
MTKLSNMDLPKDQPMYYCEKCKSWVPDKKKHYRKRHSKLHK